MTRRLGWVLNLAADLELPNPERFAPSSQLLARIAIRGRELLAAANSCTGTWLEHVELRGGGAVDAVAAWCPTPAARAVVAQAGYRPRADWPSLECLQRVNRRDYRGPGTLADLPGATVVETVNELERHLVARPGGWLLKRAYGFSGRGHRRVDASLDRDARRWVEASFAEHGGILRVEPWVDIELEVALHGWVHGPEHPSLLGATTQLSCDEHGAWQATRPSGDALLTDAEQASLRETALAVDADLAAAGYRGPFGIDAYRWLDRGVPRFHALGEVNARFTMGFFVGMTECATELADALLH